MRTIAIAALLALFGMTPALAQDISGIWQGTTKARRVVQIASSPAGGYSGEMHLEGGIEGTLNGNPISSIMLDKDGHVSFRTDRKFGVFDGQLSRDGKTITGSWENLSGKQPLVLTRARPKTAWVLDTAPHKILFVPITDRGQDNVSLEVLDYGGSGQPLVFLTGLGADAHDFDGLAPKFTGHHHVYAITRRGFGASSAPAATEANYDSDRLGDDVLAVLDALNIAKPVLAGHSIASEELSSIGTRYPERVAGLVYLDAFFPRGFYDPKVPVAYEVDANLVRRDLKRFQEAGPEEADTLIREIRATLPTLERELAWYQQSLKDVPPPRRVTMPQDEINNAIITSGRRYTGVKPPMLILLAMPKPCQANCPAEPDLFALAAEAQRVAIAADYPAARIVRLANAEHELWRSNEADVLREMNAFMDGVK